MPEIVDHVLSAVYIGSDVLPARLHVHALWIGGLDANEVVTAAPEHALTTRGNDGTRVALLAAAFTFAYRAELHIRFDAGRSSSATLTDAACFCSSAVILS